MADKRVASQLDQKLIDSGIIAADFAKDYEKVHTFMNKDVKKYDKALGEEDFSVGEKALREWLNTLNKQGASQEKLTSYLRVGLAHLCFDYIDLKNEKLTDDEHVTRALQSFKKRHYDKSFYKSSGK